MYGKRKEDNVFFSLFFSECILWENVFYGSRPFLFSLFCQKVFCWRMHSPIEYVFFFLVFQKVFYERMYSMGFGHLVALDHSEEEKIQWRKEEFARETSHRLKREEKTLMHTYVQCIMMNVLYVCMHIICVYIQKLYTYIRTTQEIMYIHTYNTRNYIYTYV